MIFIDGGAVCGTAIFAFVDRERRHLDEKGRRCEADRSQARGSTPHRRIERKGLCERTRDLVGRFTACWTPVMRTWGLVAGVHANRDANRR